MPHRPFNAIKKKSLYAEIEKNGRIYKLYVALETSNWRRPTGIAANVGKYAYDLLSAWDGDLPEATREICVRYVDDVLVNTKLGSSVLIRSPCSIGRVGTVQKVTLKTI